MKRTQSQVESEINKLWERFHALGESSPITLGISQQRTHITFDIVTLEMELAQIRMSEQSRERKTG